jgi:hypothetical protein
VTAVEATLRGNCFGFIVLDLIILLFCLPHKKVYAELGRSITKKVTAIEKFAKTVSLRAKNLNIAIKPLFHSKWNCLFVHFSTSFSIQAIVSFF